MESIPNSNHVTSRVEHYGHMGQYALYPIFTDVDHLHWHIADTTLSDGFGIATTIGRFHTYECALRMIKKLLN